MTGYSMTDDEYEVYDLQYNKENRPLFLLYFHGKWELFPADLFRPYPSYAESG